MSSREWEIKKLTSSKDLRKYLEEYEADLDDADWVAVKKNSALDNSLIKDYAESLPMNTLSAERELPADILEENIETVDWFVISLFYSMSSKFITKYKERLSLNKCLKNEHLGRDTMKVVQKLFKENNDPAHHKIWDENIQKSKMFRVYPANPEYSDYIEQKKSNKGKTIKAIADPKIDFSKMSRSELKAYLENKEIRVYYHDTVSMLIEKCKALKD